MTFRMIFPGILAPGLLALTLLAPAPPARAQSVPVLATTAVADWDDLEDYYEELAERREEYLEDRQEYFEELAERRQEYLEDYYDDLPRRYRHHSWRPSYVAPGYYGLPGYGYGYGYNYGYAPYLPRPVYPHYGFRGPIGYGYPPYGYGGFPRYGYGYGFGPRGGVDIPLFGLGGISVRW